MKIPFLFFALFSLSLLAEPLDIKIEAEAAILINARSGAVLFQKNAHQPQFPASTTKIATALLTLKKCGGDLEQIVQVEREAIASISPEAKRQSKYRSPPHWLETDGVHMGLKNGEQLPLYDLLHGMLVSSANDASNAIAQHIGGTIPNFMDELNAYLLSIGCFDTTYNNPHGLHHPSHKTTAYDLAVMAREGMKDPVFRQIVRTVRYTCAQTNLEPERICIQTNSLLKSGSGYYPKAIGIKTGTTQAAGKNLVAGAEQGGRELIAVALGFRGQRNELFRDVAKMFEEAFREPKMQRLLLEPGIQSLTTHVKGARGELVTCLPHGLYYDFYPSEESAVRVRVHWSVPSLPIPSGSEVGHVEVVDAGGTTLIRQPLLAAEDLELSLFLRFKRFVEEKKGLLLFSFAMLSVVIFVRAKMLRRKNRPSPRRRVG